MNRNQTLKDLKANLIEWCESHTISKQAIRDLMDVLVKVTGNKSFEHSINALRGAIYKGTR